MNRRTTIALSAAAALTVIGALSGCSSTSTTACPSSTPTVKATTSSFTTITGGIDVVVPHIDPVEPHIDTDESGVHGSTSDDDHSNSGSGSHLLLPWEHHSVSCPTPKATTK